MFWEVAEHGLPLFLVPSKLPLTWRKISLSSTPDLVLGSSQPSNVECALRGTGEGDRPLLLLLVSPSRASSPWKQDWVCSVTAVSPVPEAMPGAQQHCAKKGRNKKVSLPGGWTCALLSIPLSPITMKIPPGQAAQRFDNHFLDSQVLSWEYVFMGLGREENNIGLMRTRNEKEVRMQRQSRGCWRQTEFGSLFPLLKVLLGWISV